MLILNIILGLVGVAIINVLMFAIVFGSLLAIKAIKEAFDGNEPSWVKELFGDQKSKAN